MGNAFLQGGQAPHPPSGRPAQFEQTDVAPPFQGGLPGGQEQRGPAQQRELYAGHDDPEGQQLPVALHPRHQGLGGAVDAEAHRLQVGGDLLEPVDELVAVQRDRLGRYDGVVLHVEGIGAHLA